MFNISTVPEWATVPSRSRRRRFLRTFPFFPRLDPLSLDASYDAVVLVSCRVSARCLEDLEDESAVLSCADSLDSGRGADRLDLDSIPSDLIPELCSLPIPRVDVRKDGVTVAEFEERVVVGASFALIGLVHLWVLTSSPCGGNRWSCNPRMWRIHGRARRPNCRQRRRTPRVSRPSPGSTGS